MSNFGKRLEKLEMALTDRTPKLLWMEPYETSDGVARRHLSAHPEDAGREMICISWLASPQAPEPANMVN